MFFFPRQIMQQPIEFIVGSPPPVNVIAFTPKSFN